MRFALKVLAAIAIIVGGFFLLPADKVGNAVRAAPVESTSRFVSLGNYGDEGDAEGKVLYFKSGLRVAVEGRLRWLGLI